MIFDSHCHPQFPQYDKDREEVIRRTLDGGVVMICIGTDYETSKEGIKLAQKYDPEKLSDGNLGAGGMWATVGLHPNDTENFNFTYDTLKYHKLLNGSDKVVAIGEVGLDYYRTPEPEKQKKQKEVFEQFVDLAVRHDKPLVLHFRDSQKGSSGRVHKDALEVLDSSFKILDSKLRGVSHSFTGNVEEAEEYINRGMYIGFNGIITFARQYDDVVRYVPLGNILLETDAPFLAPELYRGQRNEPLYVKEVAKKVAELKNLSVDEVIKQTTLNCKELFGVNL